MAGGGVGGGFATSRAPVAAARYPVEPLGGGARAPAGPMTARGPGVKDDPAVIMRRMMITLLLSKARHNRSAPLQAHLSLYVVRGYIAL